METTGFRNTPDHAAKQPVVFARANPDDVAEMVAIRGFLYFFALKINILWHHSDLRPLHLSAQFESVGQRLSAINLHFSQVLRELPT